MKQLREKKKKNEECTRRGVGRAKWEAMAWAKRGEWQGRRRSANGSEWAIQFGESERGEWESERGSLRLPLAAGGLRPPRGALSLSADVM